MQWRATSSSHYVDSSYDVKYPAMATAAVRPETRAEIEDLLRQWRSVMAASRPRWTAADLTFTQLRALSAIAKRGSMRVSELADELGMGLAASSSLADRMV